MSLRLAPKTVRSRAALVAASVVLVALTIGAVSLVWLVRDHLTDAVRNAARLRASDVLSLAVADRLPTTLSSPGDEEGAIQVLDRSGTLLAQTSNLDEDDDEGHGLISDVRPEPGSGATQITTVPALDDADRYVVVALTSEKSGVTVLSARSLETTDEAVSTLTDALLVGVPALVLLVAATSWVLVGRTLRPVAAITTEVADISAHDLARRVPEPATADEIHQLAVTMNGMLERLEAASARQRRFVADASHEMRSPLASARTTLEVAALHPGSMEQLVSAIGDALVDHDRLERLTTDLLALARLDDRRLVISRASTDVDRLITELVARRGDEAIEVSSEVGVRDVSTQVLTQVLTNLLDNAARHRSARTSLRARVEGAGLVITVDDDGPGVPTAEREHIFEPFVRLDDARVADSGTGLGLSIVRELLHAVGGSVEVRDSDLGGASFVVHMPC